MKILENAEDIEKEDLKGGLPQVWADYALAIASGICAWCGEDANQRAEVPEQSGEGEK